MVPIAAHPEATVPRISPNPQLQMSESSGSLSPVRVNLNPHYPAYDLDGQGPVASSHEKLLTIALGRAGIVPRLNA